MPNSMVPAANEGLPNLNRFSAFAKLGPEIAASTTLAACQFASNSDPIFASNFDPSWVKKFAYLRSA